VNLVLTNADIVLPDAVVRGTLRVQGGLIADIQPGGSTASEALDLAGDYLLPGAVDLHTDNLERQVQPRAGTRWPSRSALLAPPASPRCWTRSASAIWVLMRTGPAPAPKACAT